MIAERINQITRKIPAWPIYGVSLAWAVWLFYAGVTGLSGPDPIDALTNQTGILGLQLLIAGLIITPLRRYAGVNLLRYRRAIGLSAFFFVMLHFSVWLLLDLALRWDQIISDLSKRPFIMLGMAAVLILIPLAVTSNTFSIRRMGGSAWQRLHRLTYLAVPIAALHFAVGSKVLTTEPVLYLVAAFGLVLARLFWIKLRR